VLVICDRKKLEDQRAVTGAPDFVVEVLSLSSRNYDATMKLEIYFRSGVSECWLVDTISNVVRVYVRDEAGDETMKIYRENDNVPVGILPGFSISLKEVFDAAKL
jgi:Uma2 family endonuclease